MLLFGGQLHHSDDSNMAYIKVIVGALLACAICAHGFPAGEDSLGVNRPLPGAFLPSEPTNRPAVVPFTPGVTPSRPVRDAEPDSNESKESKESHELASSAAATTAKAPARRDVTTNAPQGENRPSIPIRPLPGLQGIQTTQQSHTAVRREDSPLRPTGTTNAPSSSLRPGAKPGTTEEPSHSVTKREDSTLRPGAKPAAVSTTTASTNQKNRRDTTSTVRPVALPAQVPQKPTRQVTSAPAASTTARPQPVRPILATGATPAGSRTKRQVSSSTSAPSSAAYPTNRPLPPSRPLPVRQVTASPTPARPLPQRPTFSPSVTPAGSKTKRDDDVVSYRPLDLQRPQIQGFPAFQPSFQPGQQPSEFSGVQSSFAIENPQQPGVQTFGGVSHGTINRPDGTSSVSLSSLSSSSSRSRRDDGDYDDGEVDLE